ncbi:MAG: hypothetical protein NTV54_07215 [Ignavibacteriales bacterium]|nr:hypothetical protein [Ignavibacteriales bacterium]
MNSNDVTAPYKTLPRILSFSGVTILYWAIQQVSMQGYLTHAVALPASISFPVVMLFEHKVWEFLFGMLVIAVLSRGHLWSYGINSMDVRFSMRMLVRFYAVALVFVTGMVLIPLLRGDALPIIFSHLAPSTMGAWILLQWMASPIADSILFFGVFQTVLCKYWPETFVIRSLRIPVGGLYAAMAFVVGRVRVPIFGGDMLEYVIAAGVGLFCAWMYDRTRSLLTPMLAIAFVYGMPFIIRFAWALM